MIKILALTLLVIATSCSTEYICEELGKPTAIANYRGVYNLDTKGLNDIGQFIKQGDCISVLDFTASNCITNISLKTKTVDKQIISESGLSKAIFNNISANGRGLSVLDALSGKLFYTEEYVNTRATSNVPYIQLPKDKLHYAAAIIADKSISIGRYNQGRYLLYSHTDNKERYFLTHTQHPDYPLLDNSQLGSLYASSQIRVKPDQTAFVVADRYSGLMDICKIVDDEIIRVCEKIFHVPSIDITNQGEIVYERSNRFGFTDITTNDDFIFAIYSGKTYKQYSVSCQQCTRLLQYNWEGELIESYELTNPVSSISYDYTTNKLYALESESQNIVEINLETV